ncbi:MAG TPA: tetratricopeptide repeat protein [Pseudolabrys sp.]|nr:tetratricopeptide repeat protein [Pseudolabrys sp.]
MKPGAQLAQAAAREGTGDIAGAMTGYRKVLARQPGNVEALFLLGRAHCQIGQLDEGVKLLRRAVALQPGHAPAQTVLGMALARLDAPQEAIACFERALSADPNSTLALVNQADVLSALGRHAEAIAQLDKALAVDRNDYVAWSNRGLALEALGRDAEAARSFERALACGPAAAELHFNLANALQRLAEFKRAATHYQRAIALNPDLARAHANLGRALASLGCWEDARQSVARALKLQPGAADLCDALGYILWNLERYEDAIASFDEALRIDPSHAGAANNKARVLYVLGRMDDAHAQMERAIAIDPTDTANYLHLSEMKRFAPGDAQIAAMEALLPDLPSRLPQEQVNLHFALAKAYEDIGEPDRAFGHFVSCNAVKRKQIAYDETATIGQFDRIRAAFTPELMRAKSGQGDPSERPIFIIGMPRSGTTLIEQILASHPRVRGAGEREDFRAAVVSADAAHRGYPDLMPGLDGTQLRAIAAAYLASMGGGAGCAARFTDKLPANYVYTGLIHLALPQARIIHVLRDPLDTCLSCFTTHFSTSQAFAYELGELGRFYCGYERLMAHWRDVLPAGAMLEVRYEDVVANIETQTRRLLDYCGLDWNPACLDFHRTPRPVRTASAAQVRRPLYASAVGRAKRYGSALAPLLAALGRSG